jgi:hypothetical protein
MRNLNRVMRNSAVSGIPWKTELDLFLRSYRATPHCSTGVAPEQLLFKTISSTCNLPNYCKYTKEASRSSGEVIAKANDLRAKNRMKVNMDRKLRVQVANIRVGDRVLLSNNCSGVFDKAKPKFGSLEYVVVEVKGSMVTARHGVSVITRNSSFFRKVLTEVGPRVNRYDPIPLVEVNSLKPTVNSIPVVVTAALTTTTTTTATTVPLVLQSPTSAYANASILTDFTLGADDSENELFDDSHDFESQNQNQLGVNLVSQESDVVDQEADMNDDLRSSSVTASTEVDDRRTSSRVKIPIVRFNSAAEDARNKQSKLNLREGKE